VQRLKVISARLLPGFMVPPPAGGGPAYAGRRELDYQCGACGGLLASGVGPGAFASIAFQCRCGAVNLVEPPSQG
jgi:hypothetical protein